jgi:signal transduction histidine kinase
MNPDRADIIRIVHSSPEIAGELTKKLQSLGFEPDLQTVESRDFLTTAATASYLQFWVAESVSARFLAQVETFLDRSPFTAILLVVKNPELEDQLDALRAGACALLPRDISDNQLQAALRKANRRISSVYRDVNQREYAAARAGFDHGAARLLHDFNSPLTAIQSAFEMLEMEIESEGRELTPKESLLLKGINGGRDIAEEWHGYLHSKTPPSIPVNLYRAIRSALETVHHSHPELKVMTTPEEVHPEYIGDLPDLPLTGDRLGYELIFHHLFTNAIEELYAVDKGELRVAVEDEGGTVKVVVEDNGPGVHPELKDKLWKDFQTTKRDRGQFGMGLGIVRYLLMMMGGSIRMADEKTLGGAAFELEFRVRPPGSQVF